MSSQSSAVGGNGNPANVAADAAADKDAVRNDTLLSDLRRYLLLLAILAATVTYVAGLNPPGGVWLDTQGGHLTGNQILVVTYHARYNAFIYSNTTAFMASAVVTLLLLLLPDHREVVKEEAETRRKKVLVALRVVMSLDMLALVVAYAAGASRDMATTVLASVLVSPIFIYVLRHTLMDSELSSWLLGLKKSEDDNNRLSREEYTEIKKRRKILILLAIFATTITYTAGLNPPGGFRPVAQEGHRAGDPVLQDHHRHRFLAFFICNTASLVASLSVIMLLLTNKVLGDVSNVLTEDVIGVVPYVLMAISLLGLVGAYAAGSCRETRCTTGVPFLYMLGLALVFAWMCLKHQKDSKGGEAKTNNNVGRDRDSKGDEARTNNNVGRDRDSKGDEANTNNFFWLKKIRALVLLLATLAAAVTYQAGLNPPGGFWPDDHDGHKGGDPILLSKHPTRYRVFLYCNSTALAASLVAIFMVKNVSRLSTNTKHTKAILLALVTVMILDLIGLIGAFAAGCSRDVSTSIYVVALAGGTLVYVVFHIVFFTLHHNDDKPNEGKDDGDDVMGKKRKRLLLLAILVATLTYQAGLTPPGGFWLMDDGEPGHHAGDPVLLSNYPRRYAAFFYLNATGFMASVALTILLVNPNLYKAAIKCHALHVCMVAGLFGLTGAYAAGSSRHVRTSIYMIALIGGLVFVFVIILLLLLRCCSTNNNARTANKHPTSPSAASTKGSNTSNTEPSDIKEVDRERGIVHKDAASLPAASTQGGGDTSSTKPSGINEIYTQRKYLMLLGILAASVSYQAGLAPPGGVWPDNSDGHVVGNPILRDSNHRRYHIFISCNSISFAASMVVIALQLVVELITKTSLPPLPQGKYRHEAQIKFLIKAAHWTMVVDLIGLLGAYAAGSSREWETSGYIVALVAAVVAIYIGIHFFYYLKCGDDDKNGTMQNP